MNLWFRYSKYFPNSEKICQKIYDKHLFRKMTDFYIQWVNILVEKNQIINALSILSKAVANNCLPSEKMKSFLINFKIKYQDEISKFNQKQQV